ncbi:MAG: hypothetical protein A4E58_01330 [Syntrophorhabdus sp. PtaB.Bin006]|nr:MAG: hypothetical protein A4E58_01330 [Syntrophorhabdus sp. PtaB.Bin006]
MISDTSSMALWQGRFFVWLDWTMEKIRPMKQITMPKYMIDRPLNPPKILNDTWDRSGSMISASPANALDTSRQSVRPKANSISTGLNLLIKLICNLLIRNFSTPNMLCAQSLVIHFHLSGNDRAYSKTFFCAMSNNLGKNSQ